MSATPSHHLVTTLRNVAQAYAAGDQVAPCVVLWTDPDRLWAELVPQLQDLLPELYQLGTYSPEKRTGPAMWLRCIEGRVVPGSPPAGTTPIFYLPGISREELRGVEDCSMEVAALVELQFRGALWLHVNGKEWTPYALLTSAHGGLGLDVPKDQATRDALARALPSLFDKPVSMLKGRRLDADFFNELLAPDPSGLILRWLSEPEAFRKNQTEAEWQAFCQQCKTDFGMDPIKDGPLKAAQHLANRGHQWEKVWQRFVQVPTSYTGVTEWLKRATPKEPTMFDSAEVWPELNEIAENQLGKSLASLADRSTPEITKKIAELEAEHGKRRGYVWQKLGLSPLATALKPLADLAQLCTTSPGAPDPNAYAEYYTSDGWRVDAAALAVMATCQTQEQHGAILSLVRSLYLPWVENTAVHLQGLIKASGQSTTKCRPTIEPKPGRLVLFADGLRMDVAQRLLDCLNTSGIKAKLAWEWSTIPSVTATAKPAASPAADLVQGGEVSNEFSTQLRAGGQRTTQPRFLAALAEIGWQCLRPDETGNPAGSAWTEAGTLDKRGHNEGWKLAHSVETEVRDLASRLRALASAGWAELIVVTDHGWLLMPSGGLPKVELKAFLTEDRWGRCAALKSDAQAGVQTYKWHWNHSVAIAMPPGVGCYRASVEYCHGGISLQEMVIPFITIQAALSGQGAARISEAKWTAAKCRVIVSDPGDGMRIDLRTSLADPTTSLLADKKAREITGDGKVTLFLENDTDIGRQAEIVLQDKNGQVIHSLGTTIGE